MVMLELRYSCGLEYVSLGIDIYKNRLWDPSNPVEFTQFFIFFINFPPVVAITIVRRLSPICMIVVPVVLDELLNLRKETHNRDFTYSFIVPIITT